MVLLWVKSGRRPLLQQPEKRCKTMQPEIFERNKQNIQRSVEKRKHQKGDSRKWMPGV